MNVERIPRGGPIPGQPACLRRPLLCSLLAALVALSTPAVQAAPRDEHRLDLARTLSVPGERDVPSSGVEIRPLAAPVAVGAPVTAEAPFTVGQTVVIDEPAPVAPVAAAAPRPAEPVTAAAPPPVLPAIATGTHAARTVLQVAQQDGAPRQRDATPTDAPTVGLQSLRTLAASALARHAGVREAMAGLRAAELDIREAEGGRRPQVNLDATSRWNHATGDDATQFRQGAPYVTLSAAMPIYDFGRLDKVVDSRSASARSARARLDVAVDAVVLDTVVAAIELARQQAAVTETEAYAARIQRLVDMLAAITREDPGRSGELVQARSKILQAQVSRDALAGKVREAQIALEKLTGSAALPADGFADLFTSIPALPSLRSNLERLPGLQQLEAERQAQARLAESLSSARKPQVGVVFTHAPVAPGLSRSYASYVGISVNYAIYRGESDVAAQQAAAERAGGAGDRLRQATHDVDARLRTLHETASSQLQRAREYDALLATSETVRTGFFEQWAQTGRRSLFELLAAENEDYLLRTTRLNLLHDGLVASARLRGEGGALTGLLGLRGSAESRR